MHAHKRNGKDKELFALHRMDLNHCNTKRTGKSGDLPKGKALITLSSSGPRSGVPCRCAFHAVIGSRDSRKSDHRRNKARENSNGRSVVDGLELDSTSSKFLVTASTITVVASCPSICCPKRGRCHRGASKLDQSRRTHYH